MGAYIQYIIIGVVVLAAVFVAAYIKAGIDEKKGVDSEEKRKIQEIVKRVVPDWEAYTAAYATRKEWSPARGGSAIETSYWYYAAAFKPGDLYLIPLSFAGGDMSYQEPIHMGVEDFGMAEALPGTLRLYDKDRKEIMALIVIASNTKEDKYHPVNIQQPEAAEAFGQFAQDFMQQVNAANGITDLKMAKHMAKLKK